MGKLAIWVLPKNNGFSPQIIHFHRVFPYKPSILGYPHFLETPIWWTRNMDNATCAEPMFAASSSSSSNVEARLAVEDTGSDRFDIAKSRSLINHNKTQRDETKPTDLKSKRKTCAATAMSPQNPWKIKDFGHLKTQVIYHKKPSKNVSLGGAHGGNKNESCFTETPGSLRVKVTEPGGGLLVVEPTHFHGTVFPTGWLMFIVSVGKYTSWWLNPPIWNMCLSNWIMKSQGSGWKFQKCLRPPVNVSQSCCFFGGILLP